MRFTFSITLSLLLLCVSVLAQTPRKGQIDDVTAIAWKEFSSAEGRFTVSFPGDPKTHVRTLETAIGPLKDHSFFVETGTAFYYVSYSDFPVAPTTPDENKTALDGSRDQLINNGYRIISESDWSLGEILGREVIVEKGNWVVRGRFLFDKKRLYQIIINVPPDYAFRNAKPSANAADRTKIYEETSARFFDSFKLIK